MFTKPFINRAEWPISCCRLGGNLCGIVMRKMRDTGLITGRPAVTQQQKTGKKNRAHKSTFHLSKRRDFSMMNRIKVLCNKRRGEQRSEEPFNQATSTSRERESAIKAGSF